MKFVEEYRDPKAAEAYSRAIHSITRHPWTIMEVCGGQTHSILKFGVDELLPKSIRLIHGPGCPVCVTPVEAIDKAIAIATQPNVIFATFGDMVRVPGSARDLQGVKAAGADIRVVYSPLDALQLARENPDRNVVFFGIGFETTAPANAMAIYQARHENISNFSMLAFHVLVPPALQIILESPECSVQGFLAPGHVCTVMGLSDYAEIAQRYEVPIVAAGFEPLDILQALYMCVDQLEKGMHTIQNQYTRSIHTRGNVHAQRILSEVFEPTDRKWRGFGLIPKSGLAIRKTFSEFDAEQRFGVSGITCEESKDCLAGAILQGTKNPSECPLFGTRCTPEHPVGAPMISSEGACSAFFKYKRKAEV